MSIICSQCKRSITVRGFITCRDGLLYTGGRPVWVDNDYRRREIQCDGFVPKDEGDVLPCPFCNGTKLEISYYDDESCHLDDEILDELREEGIDPMTVIYNAFIHCVNCSCSIGVEPANYDSIEGIDKALIEKWNTRGGEQ